MGNCVGERVGEQVEMDEELGQFDAHQLYGQTDSESWTLQLSSVSRLLHSLKTFSSNMKSILITDVTFHVSSAWSKEDSENNFFMSVTALVSHADISSLNDKPENKYCMSFR